MKKTKNIFWGLFLVCAAAAIVLYQFGFFLNIGLWTVIITVLLIPVIIESLVHLNFFGVLLPLGIMWMMYAEPVFKVTNNIPWYVMLLVAILGSVGLHMIIKPKRWAFCNGNNEFKKELKKEWDKEKKQEHIGEEMYENLEDNTFECRVSFSDSTQYIHSQALQRADLSVSFGGLKVYFDGAQLHPDGAVVNVSASFAGAELYIPKTWNVKDNISVTLGGVSEKTRRVGGDGPTLTLTGSVSFAGVEIIYI